MDDKCLLQTVMNGILFDLHDLVHFVISSNQFAKIQIDRCIPITGRSYSVAGEQLPAGRIVFGSLACYIEACSTSEGYYQ